MNRLLLRAYQSLPGPLRSAAASAHGYRLRRWRYGPETERLVREAVDRETWSHDRWESWRSERLGVVLRRAAERSPYYRGLWADRGGDPADLAAWPLLEKEALRTEPRSFVADDCQTGLMYHEHTSGTSGKPVNLWFSRDTVRSWYALYEARCRRWYGVSRHDRWAILGGQLVAPAARRVPPFWVWNRGLNQLYMSSYHLTPDLIPAYFAALRRYRVKFLLGYTSSLHALAAEALRGGYEAPAMAVVVTNAEPVFEHQRRAIAEAFGCPVRETYGMSEVAAAASECEAGTLHLWPEAGHVELLEEGLAVADGREGEVVATGLLNADMPLIRYVVGDRAARPAGAAACPCGRTLPALRSIEGRTDDVLFTADGRKIGRLDPIFKADLPIREAQVVQETLGRVRIRYVPDRGWTDATGASLSARLRERMGPVEVVLEPLDAIPRGKNGKFRSVVCAIPPAERPSV